MKRNNVVLKFGGTKSKARPKRTKMDFQPTGFLHNSPAFAPNRTDDKTDEGESDNETKILAWICEERRTIQNSVPNVHGMATQNTKITFGSTIVGNDDATVDSNDDEISLASINDHDGLFDYYPSCLAHILQQDKTTGTVSTKDEQMTRGCYNSTIEEDCRSQSEVNTTGQQQASLAHDDKESFSFDAYHHTDMLWQFDGIEGFNDSMASLSDAFEKLDNCMIRTAQSRKLVRELTILQSLPSSESLSSNKECITKKSKNIPNSLPPSVSISSRGCHKGPKSLEKPGHAFRKGKLSKTGVALRTLLNASFL